MASVAVEKGFSFPLSSPIQSESVLIVEDCPNTCELLEKSLIRNGVLAECVASGERGLSEASWRWKEQEQPFDLILVDLCLPTLDGAGVSRLLRASGYPGPIYAMSVNDRKYQRKTCDGAGFDGFLSKFISVNFVSDILQVLSPGSSSKKFASSVNRSTMYHSQEYLSVVYTFLSNLATVASRVEKAFREKRWQELGGECHLLKTAGFFGYSSLQEAAIDFSAALKKRDEKQIVSCFYRLLDCLQEISREKEYFAQFFQNIYHQCEEQTQ